MWVPDLYYKMNCRNMNCITEPELPSNRGLQVSGRSDITDFEEVVRLDTEYISNWNFGLDIKILFKTVMTVLKREGSV